MASIKNTIFKHIVSLCREHVKTPVYTRRPENVPLPYIRLSDFQGSDDDYKTVDKGSVRFKFLVYSSDPSVKEVAEICEELETAILRHYKQFPEIARINVENLWFTDVNKPDIHQGEIAFRCKYYN